MSTKEQNYAGVFGGALGKFTKPVVLAIDFIRAYTTEGAAFYAPGVVDAVKRAGPFYDSVRKLGIPILHTRVLYDTPRPDAHVFLAKVPALRKLVTGEPLAEFDEHVVPAPGETVLVKQHASAFYGTDLDARLKSMGVDAVIVTGCTTSGCIRATVIDCMQHGFAPIVVEDLVGDRHPDPHEANLFDMRSKYADVVSSEEALSLLSAATAPAESA